MTDWGWQTIPAQSGTVGTAFSLALANYDPPGTESYSVDGSGDALPAGLSLNTSTGLVSGTPTTAQVRNVRFVATKSDTPTLADDWQTRISGPGVVWYHDFTNQREVDNFRWTGSFGGGNDPNAVGSPNAGWCRWIGTDGLTGGCLEVIHPAGTGEGSYWWRPFSPIQGGTTTGNGRGAGNHDPGAGVLTPQAFAPTSGGSQTYNWGQPSSARRGLYCNAAYSPGGTADGSDFYVQFRVKMDPRRIQAAGETVGGKFIWFTHTAQSYTDQELVTYSYGGGRENGKNLFRVYRGAGYLPLEQAENGNGQPQTNSDFGVCSLSGSMAGCWGWSGGWDTVLYHITPGTLGTANSRFEAWVCTAGQEAGGYVKIWDQSYDMVDCFPNVTPEEAGWSATICSAYNNGNYGIVTVTDFYHRYAQIIFSKQFIPCPAV